MENYSPPEGRTSDALLRDEIRFIQGNEIFDTVLRLVSGLVAVLDENRQILAVNESMLAACGIEDGEEIHGLRPGEALRCVHAADSPEGCGHGEHCATCGAAIAIASALGFDKPVERTCAATVERQGRTVEAVFKVRATPVDLPEGRVLLLFMRDITSESKWAALERAFFHDISNILTGLCSATELLAIGSDRKGLAQTADQLVLRLQREIEMQRVLSQSRNEFYRINMQPIDLRQFLTEVEHLFRSHPAAEGKRFDIAEELPRETVSSDYSLLLRIVSNMLINAFEASAEGKSVRLWIEQAGGATAFKVRNDGVIDPRVQKRVFQRHFSTKEGEGRGIGTYSMKLFAEEFLMGRIGFTSTVEEGTIFTLTLS